MLINVTPSETRIALVESGSLQEVHIERQAKKGLVGNIYLGKVSRVLPGMQAAFVDIGFEKAAFLHASDIAIDNPKFDNNGVKLVPDIQQLVQEGKSIMVQVVKDPLGTKGARLTTDISVPSRYLVFMPSAQHVGVSQRLDSDAERERLKNIVTDLSDDDGSFIVRTAAEGAGEKEIRQDAAFLRRLWKKIIERKNRGIRYSCLYQDLTMESRVLRDFVGMEIDRIRVDSKLTFSQLTEFTSEFIPEVENKLEYYPGERPIFDLFDVEAELQRALERKVELKSGGSLIIDQTEAMTTIDINTGAYVGHRNLEDTIFSTNIEASQAIARQLRLRNLGGIIIIDFIDMHNEDHKHRVLSSLESALGRDNAKFTVHGFSALGLVEMTRKRTRESLEHILCSACQSCNGRGVLKTNETICYEILREIVRVNRAYQADRFIVYASQSVADYLLSEETHALGELELFIGKQIKVQAEAMYGQEQFDVVMM
nr:ribonuclease G [Marinifaba aquimaris]